MNNRKKCALSLTLFFSLLALTVVCSTAQAAEQNIGEVYFKEHCAECHVDGGNIVKPTKTLFEGDRATNGIKSASDIIQIMRNPGEGMTRFDVKTLPDNEARMIAEYIINTFK
jgi:cytochrome c6